MAASIFFSSSSVESPPILGPMRFSSSVSPLSSETGLEWVWGIICQLKLRSDTPSQRNNGSYTKYKIFSHAKKNKSLNCIKSIIHWNSQKESLTSMPQTTRPS